MHDQPESAGRTGTIEKPRLMSGGEDTTKANQGIPLWQQIATQINNLPRRDQLQVLDLVEQLGAKQRAEAEYRASNTPRPIDTPYGTSGPSTPAAVSSTTPYLPFTIDRLFTPQAWSADQHEIGNRVHEACLFSAKTIARELSPTPLQQRAIGLIHEAQMLANLCITWRGEL